MDKNVIVLNGKRYDAVTGKLLGTVGAKTHTANKKVVKPVATRVNDGLRREAKAVDGAKSAIKPAAKQVSRTQPIPAKPLKRRKTERSKTLMRHVVRKPAKGKELQPIKRHYPVTAKNATIVLPKPSVKAIDGMRLARAKNINKSMQIGKFQPVGAAAPIKPKLRPIPIAPAPKIINHHTKPVSEPESTSQDSPLSIFERALAEATSHEQPAHKTAKAKSHRRHKHKKLIQSFAVMMGVLLLGGTFVFFNKDSLEVQLASVKAGFQASIPSYEPLGFHKQSTASTGDKVAIQFVSPVDRTSFTLTQQASDWDSETLYDSIASKANNYQTLQSNGRTIYLYDNNAEWVDGGILYQISGNTHLSSDQISQLASSM